MSNFIHMYNNWTTFGPLQKLDYRCEKENGSINYESVLTFSFQNLLKSADPLKIKFLVRWIIWHDLQKKNCIP